MTADVVLIECFDEHHRVIVRERLELNNDSRTLTIGRSLHADVILDDEHAAEMHATIEITPDGTILASDLGSLNGLVVERKRHYQAENLALPSNTLQIGRTTISFRTSADSLPAEKPDHVRLARFWHKPAWIAGASGLVAVVMTIYENWLTAPNDLAVAVTTGLAWLTLFIAGWVALWALLSRIMLGSWRWLVHAAIILGVAVIFDIVLELTDLGGFVFTVPDIPGSQLLLSTIALGAVLYLHLRAASRLGMRRAALLACILPVLVFGFGQWITIRSAAQNVNAVGAFMRIYPPGLRLRTAAPPDTYFDDLADLRKTAEKKRDALPASENGGGLGLFGL
ncbi:MAG: FHA domain-containing protein [Rhizobiales bacterium]|nr:FHA domain-containing protein [Hyphomicrobiales bacterium]